MPFRGASKAVAAPGGRGAAIDDPVMHLNWSKEALLAQRPAGEDSNSLLRLPNDFF